MFTTGSNTTNRPEKTLIHLTKGTLKKPAQLILLAALSSLSAQTLASDNTGLSATSEQSTVDRSEDGVALTITTREAHSRDELDRLFDEAAASATSFSDSTSANDWLRDMSDRIAFKIKDPVYRVELLSLVHKHARAVGLDPQIVLSVIEIESMFNRFAVSKSGARGLMQIMPFWVKEIGHPRDNLFHPETNLWYGCYILRHYLDRSKGDLGMALRRYNGGGDDRYSNKVLTALQKRWLVSR